MNKDSAALSAVAVSVIAARQHVRNHVSQAEDAGTELRNQKQLLQRVVNNISSSKEYPVNMVAYGLLGGEPFSGSNSQQWFLYPWIAVSAIIKGKDIEIDSEDDKDKRVKDGSADDDDDDDDDNDDNDDDDDSDDDEDDDSDDDIDPLRCQKRFRGGNKSRTSNIFGKDDSSPENNISYGMSFVYTVGAIGKEVVKPIEQHLAYHYRGTRLRHLSFCEYFQLIQIEKKPAKEITVHLRFLPHFFLFLLLLQFPRR